MKHCFIINPTAGKHLDTDALIRDIERAAKEENITPHIYLTTKRGDSENFIMSTLAKEPDEHYRFYVCGGDGTLHWASNAVANHKNAEIAVIPVGTGNDFVRNFTNNSYFFDIRRQIRGKAIPIDMLRFNDRYCINILNIGFDCTVVSKMEKIKKKPLVPSSLAYIFAVFSTFFGKFGSDFTVTADGEEINGPFMLAVFGKGSYYGGGFKSLPLASLNDGMFDICTVKKVSRTTFIKLIGKYKKGEHIALLDKYPCISYKKCEHVRFESKAPIDICADGEITSAQILDIETVPSALLFSVPDGSECVTFNKENIYQEV